MQAILLFLNIIAASCFHDRRSVADGASFILLLQLLGQDILNSLSYLDRTESLLITGDAHYRPHFGSL